jgi:hypothetical protein
MEKEETKAKLKELFAEGGYKAYTILRHVSSSGMFRLISAIVIVDNKPISIDYLINGLGVFKQDKNREGLRVPGCGMDMGFQLIYETSAMVFTDPAENEKITFERDGLAWKRSNGGYVVKQEWL